MKQIGSKFGNMLHSMFSLRGDMASYDEIENTIVSGAKLQGTNACVLILAILTASIGLNMNSTAVIIGAMLISPLMGGITSTAYGLATNNLKLAAWSAIRLGIQVFISIVTSTLYFSLSPITAPSSEILARTSPTIWDVLIAVCGGLAGIIGQTRKEKSNVIPGVAIATALMPPLCTAGYGLANRNLSYFGGAIYLFFINAFFICTTAFIILKYLRVPQYKDLSEKALRRIHSWIVLIAVITMIPSLILAYKTVADNLESSNVDSYIQNEFVFEGTQIVQKNVDISNNTIEVGLIGKELSEEQITILKQKLSDYGIGNYELKLNQTAFEQGITSDEVEQLLAELEADAEQTDSDKVAALAMQKENETLQSENDKLAAENERLQNQIDANNAKQINVTQLSSELTAINPKIKGAAAAYSDIYLSSTASTHSGIVVTIIISEKLTAKELFTVENWLCARLGNSDVTVFQQTEKDYKK